MLSCTLPVPCRPWSDFQDYYPNAASKIGPKMSAQTPTPQHGWDYYPNLRRRPHAPAAGRGRVQRQIAVSRYSARKSALPGCWTGATSAERGTAGRFAASSML